MEKQVRNDDHTIYLVSNRYFLKYRPDDEFYDEPPPFRDEPIADTVAGFLSDPLVEQVRLSVTAPPIPGYPPESKDFTFTRENLTELDLILAKGLPSIGVSVTNYSPNSAAVKVAITQVLGT